MDILRVAGVAMAVAGLLLTACCLAARSPSSAPAPAGKKIKVLMLGDSLTHYGLAPACEKELNALGSGLQWTCTDGGVGGETADRGKGRIGDLLNRENPDVVTILYAANDLAHRVKPADFQKNIEGIVAIIHAHKPEPRIVFFTDTPIDPNRHSFGRNKAIMDRGGPDWVIETDYNAVLRKVAVDQGAALIDTGRFAKTAKDPYGLLLKDGIHLTPEAYKFLGGHIAAAMTAWWKAESLHDAEAVKAGNAALAKVSELRKQLEKGQRPKDILKTLDEIWKACPYSAESAVLWHQVSYPSATTKPATTQGS